MPQKLFRRHRSHSAISRYTCLETIPFTRCLPSEDPLATPRASKRGVENGPVALISAVPAQRGDGPLQRLQGKVRLIKVLFNDSTEL